MTFKVSINTTELANLGSVELFTNFVYFFKNTGNPHLLRIHNVFHSENESIAITGSINNLIQLNFWHFLDKLNRKCILKHCTSRSAGI